jgi:hypothetical protein
MTGLVNPRLHRRVCPLANGFSARYFVLKFQRLATILRAIWAWAASKWNWETRMRPCGSTMLLAE